TFPQDYGDRLRAAGLNEGTAYGGSELVYPESFTPDQIKTALALASQPGGPTISNADIMRFLAQQGVPGLAEIGGDAGTAPTVGPSGEPIGEGGRGNISDISNLPDVTDMGIPGQSAVQSAIAAAVNAANNPIAQFGLSLAGMVPGAGNVISGIR